MIRKHIHELNGGGLPSWLNRYEQELAAAKLQVEGDRSLASFLADYAENKRIEASVAGDENAAELWSSRYYQAEAYEAEALQQGVAN